MITQYELDIKLQIASARPLLPVRFVQVLMDWDEDQVVEAVDDGRLLWAWDIARNGSVRRELRIYRDSCWDLLRERGLAVPTAPSADQAEASILNGIVPSHVGRVRATEIRRRFTCSQALIALHIEDGLLTAVTDPRRGPGGSPEVTRESVVEFLKARRTS